MTTKQSQLHNPHESNKPHIDNIYNSIPKYVIESDDIKNIIQSTIPIIVSGADGLNVLYKLINRYFFNNSIKVINQRNEITNELLHNIKHNIEYETNYAICVDIHASIYIIHIDIFEEYNKYANSKYIVYNDSFDDIFLFCDDMITKKYVTYRLSKQNIRHKIRILHDVIILDIGDNEYVIDRTIFDRLYTQYEDIYPVEGNTDIVITAQVRHKVSYKETIQIDISKKDVKYICDTQDNLIDEYNRIFPEPEIDVDDNETNE